MYLKVRLLCQSTIQVRNLVADWYMIGVASYQKYRDEYARGTDKHRYNKHRYSKKEKKVLFFTRLIRSTWYTLNSAYLYRMIYWFFVGGRRN